ncbi:MAG: hypothetical protein CMJ58_27120 [Planctomycetaceae bacterium]|nr:hypothetical protein [Planctomycetaceae bacterium]
MSRDTDRTFARSANSSSAPEKRKSAAATDDDRSLDVLEIISRRRRMIIAGVLGGWALAAAYFVVAPPVFESQSQLLVMQKDPRLATRGVGRAEDAQAAVSEDLMATQMQLVQSRRIVSEALTATGLDQLDSITKELDEDETAADYVIDNLDVTRGGEGQAADARVLNVAFRHSSPEETQQILDAIIDRYQAFATETFQDVNKEAAELIEQARSELSAELAAAEEAYRDYREQAPLLWTGDESTNIHRTRYEELQAEISQLGLDISEAAARLAIVQSVVADQDQNGATDLERLAVIDDKNAQRVGVLVAVQQGEADTPEFLAAQPERLASARGEVDSLMRLRMRERELLEEFGPRHPSVMNIREQIAVASEFLANKSSALGVGDTNGPLDPEQLQTAYVQLLARDLETFKKRRDELETLAATEETAAKNLVKYELEGESLRENMERQQALYDTVVDRLREINMATNYGGQVNEVIAAAETGEEVWPSLPICLALGTLLGLVAGGGAATVAELQDTSFRDPEDIREALDAPLLAHVPTMQLEHDEKLAAAIAASGSELQRDLVAQHLPRSKAAEVFRGLRTSVFFRSSQGDVRTIACTSPHKGDGKTTVLANLAVSIAQAGRSVLVVEADMRRPRLAAAFNLQANDGLAAVIADGAEPWDLVLASEVNNLSVLPCGDSPENPAELLTSPRFKEFLEVARDRFDYVLLDCPPVLAVADPCIVAGVADAIMLVVRTSRDSRPEAEHVKEMLDDVGANLLGAVVNCSDEGSATHAGGYRYRYAAAYMPEETETHAANPAAT